MQGAGAPWSDVWIWFPLPLVCCCTDSPPQKSVILFKDLKRSEKKSSMLTPSVPTVLLLVAFLATSDCGGNGTMSSCRVQESVVIRHRFFSSSRRPERSAAPQIE